MRRLSISLMVLAAVLMTLSAFAASTATVGGIRVNYDTTGTNTIGTDVTIIQRTNLNAGVLRLTGTTNRVTDDGSQLLYNGNPIGGSSVNNYVSNLYVTNFTITSNLYATNIYVEQNSYTSNLYVTNLYVDNTSYTSNLYVTNLYVDNTSFTSNLYVTNLYVDNSTVTSNLYVTNLYVENIFGATNNWVNSGSSNSTLTGIAYPWKVVVTNSVEVGVAGEAGILSLYDTDTNNNMSLGYYGNDVVFVVTNTSGTYGIMYVSNGEIITTNAAVNGTDVMVETERRNSVLYQKHIDMTDGGNTSAIETDLSVAGFHIYQGFNGGVSLIVEPSGSTAGLPNYLFASKNSRGTNSVLTIRNGGSDVAFTVIGNSGFSGSGEQALFDDGTYKPVTAGGSSTRTLPLLRFPDMVDGSGCTYANTNDYTAARTFMRPRFSGSAATNANYCQFSCLVPSDLNTSVDLTASIKVRLVGADTSASTYTVGMISVANSSAEAATPANYVTLTVPSDGSGASGDVEGVANVTLTGWRSAMTAGQWLLIQLQRDGSDSSAVEEDLLALEITYTSNQ